jgi:hypothetical protein
MIVQYVGGDHISIDAVPIVTLRPGDVVSSEDVDPEIVRALAERPDCRVVEEEQG